ELRSLEPGPAFFISDGLEGESYGVELEATSQILDWWRLNVGYTYFQLQLHKRPGSADLNQEAQEGDSPHHQGFVRSRMDLPHNLELDATLRYVDELPHQLVRRYVALDLRLGWRPVKN